MNLWRGNGYSVLSKNCCDFCDAFVKEMSVAGTQLAPIPDWALNLSDAGRTFKSEWLSC